MFSFNFSTAKRIRNYLVGFEATIKVKTIVGNTGGWVG